ncbi:MAG: hypothetical protein A2W85_06915 [Bacteroidetes bacterium GWF2_41_31]|nr:MAG: hypothetical protein A2W85_06915 [Bacteroidetes bacterium GWF2_41_31]
MRNLFLIPFLFYGLTVMAQVNAGPDQIICKGSSTSLQGSGQPGYTYQWNSNPPDISISNPTILNPTVQPNKTTVYTLDGRSVSPTNLVVNGDFENGNTGFVSSYIYSPGSNGLWNEGTYAITSDASFNHNNFSCNTDHTTGNGSFMAVNGSSQANVVVWKANIFGITPNTEYEFSTWVAKLSTDNPAKLQFSINGILLGDPFIAKDPDCQWYKFFEKWNSGNATTAEISIVNQNTIPNGNDFSLDDINFSKVSHFIDDCTVTVASIPSSDFDLSAQTCSRDTTMITYTGQVSTLADFQWDFDNPTTLIGSDAGPYYVQWSSNGPHTVTLTVTDTCTSVETSKTIVVNQSPASTLTADATSIPYGTTTMLHGAMSGNPGPVSFEWSPSNMLLNAGIQDAETVLLEQNTLFTFAVTDGSNLCITPDTLTIHVTGGPLQVTSLIANPYTICLGQSTDLTVNIQGGSGNYTSTWSSDPPGFNHSGNESTITVSPVDTTIYFVTVTDGFSTTTPLSVQIIVLPQIQQLLQPTDTLIEAGQSAIFTVEANNLQYYQWQVSSDMGVTWTDLIDNLTYSGSQSRELSITNAEVSLNGNLYRCLLSGACDPVTTDAAELTVILSPEFIGILQTQSVCQSDTVFIPCQITNFTNIDSLSLHLDYNASLLQFLSLKNVVPDLNALGVSQAGNSVNLEWRSNAGVSIQEGTLFELGFLALTGGDDTIVWNPSSLVRNSYGFLPSLSLIPGIVHVNALPVAPDIAVANPDSLSILDEISIDLSAQGGSGTDLLWTSDSCSGNQVGQGTTLSIFRPEHSTTYYAKWKNQCGLSECIPVYVKISEQFSFAVPNAFTPNGDGLNDEFGAISVNKLAVFTFQIYNRWGELIFTTNNQDDLWNGTFHGKKVDGGTYVWKVGYRFRLDGKGSEQHSETGTVTVIN